MCAGLLQKTVFAVGSQNWLSNQPQYPALRTHTNFQADSLLLTATCHSANRHVAQSPIRICCQRRQLNGNLSSRINGNAHIIGAAAPVPLMTYRSETVRTLSPKHYPIESDPPPFKHVDIRLQKLPRQADFIQACDT